MEEPEKEATHPNMAPCQITETRIIEALQMFYLLMTDKYFFLHDNHVHRFSYFYFMYMLLEIHFIMYAKNMS